MPQATTQRLTDDERTSMDVDGYVLREGIFGSAEVAEIIAACESLLADLVRDRQGRRYTVGSYVFDDDELNEVTIKWEGDSDVVHGLEPFAHLSPVLERWAYDPRFVEPMVDFVGHPNPVLFTEKLNLKRPRHGGVNPLHQDFPYWEHFADDARRVATAMLFLDDASIENGTLQVVPGSHTQGKWRTRKDKDPFGNLEIDPAAAEGVDRHAARGSRRARSSTSGRSSPTSRRRTRPRASAGRCSTATNRRVCARRGRSREPRGTRTTDARRVASRCSRAGLSPGRGTFVLGRRATATARAPRVAIGGRPREAG